MGVRVIEATQPIPDDARRAFASLTGAAVDPLAEVADAAVFDSVLGGGFDVSSVASAIEPPETTITGTGAAIAIDAAQNNAYRVLGRAWDAGAKVTFAAGKAAESAGTAGTAGRWLVSGLDPSVLEALAVDGRRTSAKGVAVSRPRIAVFKPWTASMDEGWTRWLLERYEIDFINITPAEIVAGNLEKRFDVVLLVDMSSREILEGHARGSVPPRYAGGIGARGVRALDRFVRAGGTLVALNRGAMFAVEQLHLAVENVVADEERTDFFLGGSLVEMEIDPSHPVMTGMAPRAAVFVDRSPVFGIGADFEGAVLAKYPASGSPLLSGYLLGEERLQGWASALDVHHGDGHVILLGMRPQWRGQPFGTFKLLFGALLYTSQVADEAPVNPGFWSPPATESTEADE